MKKKIKCVVWDLDNTLWNGILLESNEVTLKHGIKEIIQELDSRGILNSIASRNNYDDALKKLKEFGIDEYFIFAEINWNAKSVSISNIQKKFNIGMDSILFIDDQDFELDEVKDTHIDINVMQASEYKSLLDNSALQPEFVTEDSKRRRQTYIDDIKRCNDEECYKGPKKEFLESLNMSFIISNATQNDLKRAHELTVRTNQLNATACTYSYEELDMFRKSEQHKLLICELKDKYGSYGKIGLALIEETDTHWHIKLLLMSCRVMSRGVGTVLISFIAEQAKEAGKKLFADFKKTDRNRMMYLTYRLANFEEVSCDEEGNILFENQLLQIQPIPPYLEIKVI